jgi:MGT family glycosyltransferase
MANSAEDPHFVRSTTLRNQCFKTVTFVSVPFSGHFNILKKFALDLSKSTDIAIYFIITGWNNITVSEDQLTELKKNGIHVRVLNDEALETSAPMLFTFPRVVNLVDNVIDSIKASSSDLVIYDFFAMEGFFAGKRLSIPSICSIPAIIGPFNPENSDFKQALKDNRAYITKLEEKFDMHIASKLEMVSDAFLLPSDDMNIVWSWPRFIKASDFLLNRNLKHVFFARMQASKEHAELDLKIDKGQKLIYVSLGTVVTKNLWNNVPEVRSFVLNIFNELLKNFGEKKEYQFVISTGRDPKDIFTDLPSNFHVFERVPQVSVLQKADLFVTHGGGNSVNEAVDAEVPMIAIPFFGDQHLSALNIERSGIGRSFLHQEDERERAINTKSGLFERKSLKNINDLSKSIKEVLDNDQYKNSIKKLKKEKPRLSLDVISLKAA